MNRIDRGHPSRSYDPFRNKLPEPHHRYCDDQRSHDSKNQAVECRLQALAADGGWRDDEAATAEARTLGQWSLRWYVPS
jgi:hypothetical protein